MAYRIDAIMHDFREQKQPSRKYSTSSLEQKLIGAWVPDQVSLDDYGYVVEKVSKYLVKSINENDLKNDEIMKHLGQDLHAEVNLLSEIGLTKNQIARAIRKKDLYKINDLIREEPKAIAIPAIYSRDPNARDKIKQEYTAVKSYLEDKKCKIAKTIAGRTRNLETAEKYRAKYEEAVQYAKDLGYEKQARTIASKVFSSKDHLKKAEQLATEYDKSLDNCIEMDAAYPYNGKILFIRAKESIKMEKNSDDGHPEGESQKNLEIRIISRDELDKIQNNLYGKSDREFCKKLPFISIRERINNKGFGQVANYFKDKKFLCLNKEKDEHTLKIVPQSKKFGR